jgi:hypothetical protein
MSMVQIVGGAFQNTEGQPLANGTLTFALSQDAQVSGQEICSGDIVTVNLDDTGNVPTSPATDIWPNDQLSPTNTFYTISAYSAEGQLVWGPNAQQILSNPSPFNLGALVPGSVNFLPNSGLGSMAFQNANDVDITGGTISGAAITGGSINGTPIGGSGNPAAAIFTNLALSGSLGLSNGFGTAGQVLTSGGSSTSPAIWITPSSGGDVTSVFGRTGAVTAETGDYTVAEVTGAAPLASPTFTGTVTAPTVDAALNGTLGATAPNTVAATTGSFSGTVTAPTFTGALDGNATTASVATNLAGIANSGWYNSSTNETTAVALGVNKVMVTNSAGQPMASATLPTDVTVPSSQVSGLGTMATQNANAVAITGGSINGTPIGALTPSTINATTIIASGTISSGGATLDAGTVSATTQVFAPLISAGSSLQAANPDLATSSANASAPPIEAVGSFWNGSSGAVDTWSIQAVLGTGANPTSTLEITHSGSPGTASVTFPGLVVTAAGFASTQTPTASTTASDHSIPITVNGTTFFMRLSSTP